MKAGGLSLKGRLKAFVGSKLARKVDGKKLPQAVPDQFHTT
jgi:hypothetical protein